MVTSAQLKKLFPSAKAALVAAVVDNWDEAAAAGIDKNTKRRCCFLASIGTETGGLKATEENMNYTTAKQIRKTWPSRFKSEAAAQPYVRQPKKLAILVYGGRMGNAASPSTDGWDFRGGGMLQTTGRAGYRKMGFENNPEGLRDPVQAFLAAVREWKNRNCNALADKGDLEGVRKAINGGLIGFDEFEAYYRKALSIFKDQPIAAFASLPDESEPVGQVYTDQHRVSLVQTWLRNLGYPEVGNPNGELGPFTKGAIRDYRADKGLPPGDFIDDKLMLALATDTEPRELPESRTEATAADVREKVPEAQGNWLGKVWTRITAAGSFVVAAASAAWDNLGEAKTYLEPIKDFVGDVPTWLWFVAVAGAAFMLSRKFAKSEQASIDAFKTGARR